MFNTPNSLYKPSVEELRAFGKHWCGPEEYEPWKSTLVAVYPAVEGDYGQTVKVYGTSAPATFYAFDVLPEPDGMGNVKPAFHVSTGTGTCKLVAEMADAIAKGMIGFHVGPMCGG